LGVISAALPQLLLDRSTLARCVGGCAAAYGLQGPRLLAWRANPARK
jgi:hypothetical protein